MDKHSPVRSVRKKIEPLTLWFDSDCIKAKRNKRRLERAHHRTGLVVDRVHWTKAIRAMHTLFNSKEHAYWEAKAAASNSKKPWQILNKLMYKDVKSQIPDSATAEAFSKKISHKVESVRSARENAAPPSFSPCPKPCFFDTFQPLTPEQVLILIKRAPDKTLDLDPVPTWLVQEFAPIFALFFAHVFSVSLERSCLPASQKKAIVHPGLKKPSLDPDELSNYRPISNLSFVSKLLEQAVHAQLLLYLNDNELLPTVKSAYRQFFSTETAVLKVVTDILSFVENDIELFGNRIAPVHTVRDLGVMLDSNMTMSQHVLRVCQNCYFQIRLIRRLGKALSVESKLLLVHALVHSQLDYCNSVLARLPWSLVQSVLNSAARLIFGLKRFDHITPALMDLHWLSRFHTRSCV